MVPDADTRADYNCNGATKDFAVPWYFLEDSHLRVLLTAVADETYVPLTLGVDYSVTGAGNELGGSITTVATYSNAYRIGIIPDIPFDQTTELENGDKLPAASLERMVDKTVMLARQLKEMMGRAVRGSENSSAVYQLPPPVVGSALGWVSSTALGNVASSQVEFAADLANTTLATKGAGMSGFAYALAYAAGTVGAELNALAAQGQYADTAGTAPTYTATVTNAPSLVAGREIAVKLHATNGTTQPTLNVNGTGAKNWMERDSSGTLVPARLAVSGVVFRVVYDGTQYVTLNPLPPIGSAAIPVRQTVHAGPMDTAGLPTFLPSTSANLNLTTQNVSASAPLCVTGALGYDVMLQQINVFGRSTSSLTWTGLTASRAAATPNFLYVTINSDGTLTTGQTILAPVYQVAGTPSTTDGQHTFNWSEMKMYVGNGSTASVVNRVFVGEAATDGTGVISTVAYAYNGFWTDANQAYPGTSSVLTRSHNVGAPVMDLSRVICTTADRGYAVGDEFPPSAVTDAGGTNGYLTASHNLKTISFSTGPNAPYIRPLAGGAAATMTTASWRVQGRVKRVF